MATIRAGLQARLIDEMHLTVSPMLLGRGESLFVGLDLPALGYRASEPVAATRATHVVMRRE